MFRRRVDDGSHGHARDAALRQQHVRAVLDGSHLVPERNRLGAPRHPPLLVGRAVRARLRALRPAAVPGLRALQSRRPAGVGRRWCRRRARGRVRARRRVVLVVIHASALVGGHLRRSLARQSRKLLQTRLFFAFSDSTENSLTPREFLERRDSRDGAPRFEATTAGPRVTCARRVRPARLGAADRVDERGEGRVSRRDSVSRARRRVRSIASGVFPNVGVCGKGCEGFDTARETLLRTFAFHRARRARAKRRSRRTARPRSRARNARDSFWMVFGGVHAYLDGRTNERDGRALRRRGERVSVLFATCCVARKRKGTVTAKTGAAGSAGSDSAEV